MYLGSDDEFTEISPERAQSLLERWVEIPTGPPG